MIEAVIFDLGNVLIDFDHRIAASRIAGFTDKAPDEIFGLFFDSELTRLFEEGKISPQNFFLKVKEILSFKLSFDEFTAIWNDIFFLTGENLAVYKLAQDLKRRYKSTLLSNINVLHLEYIKKRFPVFDAFHNVIVSCELGIRKPKAEMYCAALKMLGVAAGNTFYTDDRPELVESASSLGIRGFVFQGVEKLKRDLAGAGIKTG